MKEQPLYKKIYQDLKKNIFTGVYQEDGQLPTELELSEMYDVSRITSKRALVELENEGLIYRIRGKGSFVKKRDVNFSPTTNNNVLFIMPFAQNEGFGNYAEGILEAFKESEFRLQMQPHEWLFSGNDYTLKQDYAGIIYYPINTQESIDFLYKCQMQEIPVVLLDKTIEKIKYDAVVADNEAGGQVSTEHLIDSGCDDVLFISGNRLTDVSSVRDRYLGYLSVMYKKELTPKQLTKYDDEGMTEFFQRIYELVSPLVGQSKKVGLVVENDVVAIRLMTYLKQQQLDIPKEVGLVGFDNIQAASLMDPPLTTVAQNFYKMGEMAANLLMKRMNYPTLDYSETSIPIKLVTRSSSK